MNGIFTYLPRPGEEITVSRDEQGRCVFTVCGGTYAAITSVPVENVRLVAAGIAAAMHEAAGLPAPVILERPGRVNCDQLKADDFRTYLATGNLVGIDGISDDISPAAARFLAARLAALADIAESEPDPAEVEELAAKITDELQRAAGAWPWSETAARAALRWMRDKQQRGGDGNG